MLTVNMRIVPYSTWIIYAFYRYGML